MIRKQAIVHGEVQGVGFRYNTQAMAVRLGVTGCVSNQADGTVLAEVEGDADTVERMISWLGSGPTWATVTSVDVSDVPTKNDRQFSILE